MKIVHILNSLKGGGIQNFVLSLAPEQVNLDNSVSIIVIDQDHYDYSKHLKSKLESRGVDVFYLNKVLHSKVSFLKTLVSCRILIRKMKPDIVNTHGEMSHIYGSFATIGTSIKHYITIHNGPEIWDILNKLLNNRKPLIYCSKAAFDLRVQNNSIYKVIENGISPEIVKTDKIVDLRNELHLNSSDKIVVLVGSLRPQKNYQFLKDIVDNLNDKSIHFCVCGGNYGKGYISADEFMKYDTIHFLGLRSDVSAIENGADLFLSCSKFEGLPIAVLEAFFNGIPCVLSPIEQHINISKVEQCWIPSSFDAKSFVFTIKEALKERKSHKDIYVNRLSQISKYSITKSAKEYIKFYKK